MQAKKKYVYGKHDLKQKYFWAYILHRLASRGKHLVLRQARTLVSAAIVSVVSPRRGLTLQRALNFGGAELSIVDSAFKNIFGTDYVQINGHTTNVDPKRHIISRLYSSSRDIPGDVHGYKLSQAYITIGGNHAICGYLCGSVPWTFDSGTGAHVQRDWRLAKFDNRVNYTLAIYLKQYSNFEVSNFNESGQSINVSQRELETLSNRIHARGSTLKTLQNLFTA